MKHFSSFASVCLLVTSLLLLSSCSDNPTAVAKERIKQQVEKNSNGYFEMTSFKKTDGVEQEHRGTPAYQLTYEVEVTALKDGGWVDASDGLLGTSSKAFSLGAKNSSFTVSNEQCGYDNAFFPPSWECKNTQLKKGEKFKAQGQMNLEKHEQGWVIKN